MKLFTVFTVMLASMICFAGCASPDAKSPVVRVMTYNIHHGEGLDGKIDLERIADLIRRENVDVVALQEVDRGVERSGRRDLPKDLAKLTGMKAYFDRNIFYQGGEYGNAVLTKFPIKDKKNRHYEMLRADEQRGVLQLLLKVRGKEFWFLNTHIDYRSDDSERLMNADEVKSIVDEAGQTPVIVCGDFNDTPGSRTHKKFSEFLSDSWDLVGRGDGFTFSAARPEKRIDYIWITRNSIQPIKMEVLKSEASDHLPLVGEFRLR